MLIMLRLILIVVAVASAGGAWANAVSGMRLIGDAARTRFVVDLEASPDYGVSRLSNPDRLVIDLADVKFDAEAKSGKSRGLVSDYRFGLIAPKKARIVLDLVGPVDIVNTFVLDPVSGEPARLVVDLAPTSSEKFEAAARHDRPKTVVAAPQRQATVSSGRPVVVIDPGHGGIDSGAVGADGLLEKDVTLEFGLKLARRLRADGILEPVLTRDDDTYISLGDRVDVGRQHRAALFVSIHADTVRQQYVRGATVYTLSEDASDAMAAALAEQENRSDILAGLAIEDEPDDVANILFDLARRETRNLSVRFAKSLVTDMKDTFALNSNPWRRASFKVLKAAEVPSVLLELGYLSSPKDEKLFRSDGWPGEEASTVAHAIEAFVGGEVTAGTPIR